MVSFFQKSKGFTLIEVVVGIGVFLIFSVGIYESIQFVFQSVYQSRLRIIESGMLSEQVEIIRNMPFDDVGIFNGSPSGVLERTVTTTANGIFFTITRTVRNIDDPFDGTIDGQGVVDNNCQGSLAPVCHNDSTLCISENALQGHLNHGDTEGACGVPPLIDNSPADYKLVDIEIICTDCKQREPVRLSTMVAPKFLEGDPDNGALFVQVFDANADPVQGATVRIIATSTDPIFDFEDTTDNEGYLRIVDLPGALNAYDIIVTKSGFTTDRTTSTLANPSKPLASVVAQNVTQVSFSIDEISHINLSSIDSFCTAVSGVDVSLQGSTLVGTSPDVYFFDQSVTTDGTGSYVFSPMEWDIYSLQVLGYDIIGSIPGLPLNLPPGIEQSVQLLVGDDTANSLLIHVQDSITGQPVSSALVHVTGNSFDEMDRTGVGHVRQTDWSGGSGQLVYTDTTRYFDDGGVDVLASSGNVHLQSFVGQYADSGEIESSIIDLGTTPNYVTIQWEPFSQPTETGDSSLKFQIATSNSSTAGSWTYLGPDGTAGTYYDENTIDINSIHDGDRYLRYTAYFSTASTTFTPTLSDVSVTYTNSCTPPGQLYFGNIFSQEYTIAVGGDGFQTSTQQVTVDGDIFVTVELVGS